MFWLRYSHNDNREKWAAPVAGQLSGATGLGWRELRNKTVFSIKIQKILHLISRSRRSTESQQGQPQGSHSVNKLVENTNSQSWLKPLDKITIHMISNETSIYKLVI